MSDNEKFRIRNRAQIDGKAVGTLDVIVQDVDGLYLLVRGTAVPNAAAGFAKGCLFIKTDAGNGVKSLYENVGTTASCTFNLIGEVTDAEIGTGAVTETKLGALAVTTGKIANAAVTYDKLASKAVTGAILATGKGYFSVTALTTNTTPVNVFGVGGAPCDLIVKHVRLTAVDATASTITIATDGNTITTIAKGTAPGALVGATAITNGAIATASSLTIVSDGAGEAFVEIAFEVA